ncbi:uncharacterized protein EKO05_0005587 [Ascochyta rabiei]|uniref:uncharacterized protein n=1 Tax=Didymella rabiei TaxID=5454 RepID=UPI00220F4558|nr:uncharacterized protein EKO05_0005587 [Ascochyta rabiei]UPX15128.1 hypothetical protein EKO05_0005587 [Ascochyta rabiei]
MSTSNYTPTIELGYNLSYSKDLGLLFCSNSSCLTSINSNKSTNIVEITKQHLIKQHRISFKDREVKRFLEDIKDYSIANINSLHSIENYKYFFKELKLIEEGYLCLVKECNSLFSTTKSLYLHLEKHRKEKEIPFTSSKKTFYKSNIKIQSLFKKKDLLNYFIIKDNSSTTSAIEPTITTTTLSTSNSLINSYREELEAFTNATNLSFTLLENKEIPSTIRKTKFYLFLNNKNLNSLLKLVTIPIKKSTTTEERVEYNLLKLVEETLYSIEPLVEKLNRRLRQQLQTEVLATNKEKNLKDFSLLSSKDVKRKYYKNFSLFIVYLYRVIRERARDKSTTSKQPIVPSLVEELVATIVENIKDFLEASKENLEDSILDTLFTTLVARSKEYLIAIVDTLLEQPLAQDNLEEYPSFNSAIITFLAIKSIDLNKRVTKAAISIEQDCSYLIYSLRLFSIAIVNSRYNKLTTSSNSTSLEEVFLDYYSRNLTFNSSNSFKELTSLRAYTRAIATNTLTKPRIRDISSNLFIVDNSLEVDIKKLKKFFVYIEDTLEEFLFSRILYLNPSNLDLDFNKIEDSVVDTSPTYSFLEDSTNNRDYNLKDYSFYLIKRLEDTSSIFSKFFINSITSTSIDFNIYNIRKYLKDRQEFIKLLGLAFYLLAACPIRGTEVELLKYTNSLELGSRNLYIDSITKLIKVETSYSKSNSITNRDNNIVRFFSPKFSYLLKVYITLGIPFYNYLNFKVFNIKKASPYLLEVNNKLITSKDNVPHGRAGHQTSRSLLPSPYQTTLHILMPS